MKKKTCLLVVAVISILASMVAFIAARMTHDDFSPEFLAELAEATPQEAYRIAAVRTSPDPAASSPAWRHNRAYRIAAVRTSPDLLPPVRLEADGEPINIGTLSNTAHAGPWIADVDGDGDRDLLVGDFPGYFWLFENKGTEEKPVYTGKGKLQAGGEDAKTPVS